jgi:DNA-binding transcriptional MocR family regulator
MALQWTSPSFFAELVTGMIESGAANDCVAAHQAEMAARLAIVEEQLPNFERPSLASYHVWLPVPDGWRLDETVADLAHRGVKVSPSTHFRVNDEPEASFRLRVCLGSVEERSLLPGAISSLQANWSGQPRLSATIV